MSPRPRRGVVRGEVSLLRQGKTYKARARSTNFFSANTTLQWFPADLAELYEPACEDAGLSFESSIAAKTLILADRGLLSQTVSNLLENAIKYTPRGGSIRLVSRKKRGGGVEISIRDNGPGIPTWDRERVKERFVRLDKSRSLPGSGLGLSLVEAVADLHRAEFVMLDNEDLPSVEKGGDPDRPGLSAALIFPRVKAESKSSPNQKT